MRIVGVDFEVVDSGRLNWGKRLAAARSPMVLWKKMQANFCFQPGTSDLTLRASQALALTRRRKVLAESQLQLGQFGQTFRWLLENDVGYTVNLIVSHEGERDKGGTSQQTPLMVHKDALVSYARLFPPMVAAIDRRRMVEGSPQTMRGADNTLVGFGVHCDLTYQALHESMESERASYVQFVRQAAPAAKASRLVDLRKYVQARDAEKAALVAAGKAARAAQPPQDAAVWSEDGPSDADLLAAAAELLPRGWRLTLPEEQHDSVGRALFRRAPNGQVVLTTQLRLWWHPPGARPVYTQPPATSHPFFLSPFFLWVPYRMWAYHFRCPTVACGGKLAGAGLYKTVRRVLDRCCWYFMGTEYLECSSCHKKVPGWSQDILGQLDIAHREQFPAILTYKLSCDRAVIGQMKERTLGNNASRLCAFLVEQHTREWMARSMLYLSVLHKLRAPGAAVAALPTMHPVPTVLWLINVYITKKLAGGAAGTAAWVTNVGNEYGQVLMSVLTAAEGDGLVDMAARLMWRYREAGKAPPKVLYVDRDCCTTVGQCKTSQLFHEWHELVVKVDVWHFMRRFARGVTTDSHQLYGLFMARLSFAIFEWDAEDLSRLKEAKQSEEGRDAQEVKLSAKELARHCRRGAGAACSRSPVETERLVQEVLDAFWHVTDSMGVPLIDRARMEEIWSTQRRHLDCLQDPAGVDLYTKTGELTKGGTGAVLQQELADPDEEEAGEGSDEGFEEEEEIHLLEHHSALLQSSNLTRPPGMDQMEVLRLRRRKRRTFSGQTVEAATSTSWPWPRPLWNCATAATSLPGKPEGSPLSG
ncbi:unnamed protein product [Merluccius merluccius]